MQIYKYLRHIRNWVQHFQQLWRNKLISQTFFQVTQSISRLHMQWYHCTQDPYIADEFGSYHPLAHVQPNLPIWHVSYIILYCVSTILYMDSNLLPIRIGKKLCQWRILKLHAAATLLVPPLIFLGLTWAHRN